MKLFIDYVIVTDWRIMNGGGGGGGGGTVQQHNVQAKFRDNQSNHSKIVKGADTNIRVPSRSCSKAVYKPV
jgi:hypothetical protein